VKARRKVGCALYRVTGPNNELHQIRRRRVGPGANSMLQQVKAARNNRKAIIEVMRDTTRNLSGHTLRLRHAQERFQVLFAR